MDATATQLHLATRVRVETPPLFRRNSPHNHPYAVSIGTRIDTGERVTFLTDARGFNLDLLHLCEGLDLQVRPDSNGLKARPWTEQTEEFQLAVIERMEAGEAKLKPAVPQIEPEDSLPATIPEASVTTTVEMHPAIPVATELIAAVGREAMRSGLIATGYAFLPPHMFQTGGVNGTD